MDIRTSMEHLDAYKIFLRVMRETRAYLDSRGYLQIDLPVLSPSLIPESYLEIFKTQFRYFNKQVDMYLTPSPELFLKRILAYGHIHCYSLGKSFRNGEPDSQLHSGEFTMLEFYRLGADYMDIAEELLGLLRHLAHKVNGSDSIEYQGTRISFSKWEKITVADAFERFAGIPTDVLFDAHAFMKQAAAKGYTISGFTYEDVFSQLYSQEVEPQLGMNGYPTLLYDYPKEFAALAKLNEDGKTAQRFEFYIAGIELGDCYTELTDAAEQNERFIQEAKKRAESGKQEHLIDKGFVNALKYGLDPCAGIAVGFDRLAMIMADKTSIEQLQLISIR